MSSDGFCCHGRCNPIHKRNLISPGDVPTRQMIRYGKRDSSPLRVDDSLELDGQGLLNLAWLTPRPLARQLSFLVMGRGSICGSLTRRGPAD
ncbi:hypothetical protein DPEC_G00046880 [Dallia pectoralis]|uniref:Uncharacterized protein n=1 Tax=Dallia pectoralis TaxID=75939 RepID=A0ACC2HA13_DALPE|nr:hypothetical protein DPEC_G00046880 [Dallia pectoralis]